MIEDGAYSRMLRKYYARERPLPRELAEICDLVNAKTKSEIAAVEKVLKSFFTAADDGWHQARCDEEIERYREAEPEREAKRLNNKERKRRSRERRAQLFEELRAADIVPAWDTSIAELERLRGKLNGHAIGHAPVTRDGHTSVTPVTPLVTCDGTAIQTPLPTSQSPYPNKDTPPTPSRGRSVGGKSKSGWTPPKTWEEAEAEEREAAAREGPIDEGESTQKTGIDQRPGARHAVR